MTFETGRMITCLITRLSAMTSVLGVCEKTYQNHFLYIIIDRKFVSHLPILVIGDSYFCNRKLFESDKPLNDWSA